MNPEINTSVNKTRVKEHGKGNMRYFEKNYDWNDPDLVSQYDELPLWSSYFVHLLLENIPLKSYRNDLDVGCGTGIPLIEICQQIGKGCKCYGIDPWGRALERIRLKACTLKLDNIELIEKTADSIPFEDNCFDIITSNLGINNFSTPAKVIAECFRVLRTSGRMCITSNLTGTFGEFYEVFKQTLTESGLGKYHSALEEHIKHRGTSSSISGMFTGYGFEIVKKVESSFTMRYLNGTSFLNHSVINSGFFPSWRSIFESAEIRPLFDHLERNLNKYSEKHGELRVTVPMLYLECGKPEKVQIR